MAAPSSASEPKVEAAASASRKGLGFKLLVWLLFGVALGLLPLIASAIKGSMSARGFEFGEVVGDGELFIVSAVIAAAAMGELFSNGFRENLRWLTVLAGFWTLLAFAANTMAYMSVPSAPQQTVVRLSTIFFLVTLPASGLSVGMAADK